MPSQTNVPAGKSQFGVFLALLLLILAVLFRHSFESEKVVFANDGPLGAISAQAASLPGTFTGFWMDLTLVGFEMPSAVPNFSVALDLLLKPMAFAKFYAPASLLLLGISAWLFFRQLGFSALVCLLGGLATALNMNTFSNACWGQCSRALTQAAVFAAMAALQSGVYRRPWLKSVIAGMAVGFGIMEGFDVGALFSLVVAAYAMFVAWTPERKPAQRIFVGVGHVAVMAAFAAFIATHVLVTLVNTQLRGIIGTAQDAQTKQQHWDFATQWSLPKLETLRVIIPGLFGYRMVDEGSRQYPGCYWGRVGEQPGFEKHHQGFQRHSGAGEYAGILVLLLAAWALAQSARKKDGPFNDQERRAVWFWGVTALICLVLGWGRHAPLYRVVYALPFFSTIRSPIKFMHLFHLCLVILCVYGLQGLARRYLEVAEGQALDVGKRLKQWWTTLRGADQWIWFGYMGMFAVSLFGLLLYAASRRELVAYLQKVGFPEDKLAASIAAFSINEVLMYVLFFGLSLAALVLVMSGFFAGRRATAGGLLLGLILVVDLTRSNQPWIIYYNYLEKYASNAIIDVLRQKPYAARATSFCPPVQLPPQTQQVQETFKQLFYSEWLQHHFLYYNIPSVRVAQMPRKPQEYQDFQSAFGAFDQVDWPSPNLPRYWQLTSTRYLVGLAGMADALNSQFDQAQRRFRVHTTFDVVPKPGVEHPTRLEELTAEPKTNGTFALIEFTGALPRAGLYTHWQVLSNDQAVLKQLAEPAFDPAKTVLLSSPLPVPPPTNVSQTVRPLEITRYAPKEIKIAAKADAPSVLLLTDKHHPGWKVWVDGQPDTILRANFLLRGVYLKPGPHEIVFRFQPPVSTLYVSLAAIGLGLLLGLFLIVERLLRAKAATP